MKSTMPTRHDRNQAVADKILVAMQAVDELGRRGFAIADDGVDVTGNTPIIRVRHSRHCDSLPGECLARSDGPKEHWSAPFKGCTVVWTVRFGQGEVVAFPTRRVAL
ncbi:hypothetical protein [Methylogaea oryzae]|uniref:Uncharacterized protein n=1 Tax=Methylogaea oryzae TaxID=1295382 RepID=A0A8D5AHK2_9GAMM|nr:hypothetical protein [Methylogaea oryzae]BBL70361.1 hypothetical protein MoryE10_09670 [Methylogaea oryzae]